MVRAAQLDVEFGTTGIDVVNRDIDSLSGRIQGSSSTINAWGKGLLGFGALITGAFTAPIIAGSKAAWGQVDAVEQATVALRAYESDADAVNKVLADLISYARSDMGVLFQRQDLFAAAQGLKIMGAETENLVEYVEIMSRSVGLGVGSWDELSRVIGRVGATGRMTGDDFDMLTKMGYQLDDSLRNTNMTWEELFMHLDKGIPADALAGQADTIRGKSIRLQSALRGLGLAFLGVDSETSKFIEGGLGWQMMRGMERLTELMKRAAPAVQQLGNVFAAIGRPIGMIFDLLLKLPQPVQTAILLFTAFVGVASTLLGGLLLLAPVIAALPAAFAAVAAGASAFMAALVPLLPVIAAVALAVGALFAAYKTNFLGFGDAVDTAIENLGSFTSALDILLGKPSTKNFDIVTTADNVWEQWQLQEDGTYKHVELGISSTPDDNTLQYMGYDESTGKWVVLHVASNGDETTMWVKSSSQDPSNPDKFYMELEAEGGETVSAIYDQVTGTYEILSTPATFELDADKAIEDLKLLEKAAVAVRSVFILVNARMRELSEILAALRQRFQPVIDFAREAYEFFDPFRTVIEQVTATFRTLNAILTGDWGAISWEDIMDAAGLGPVYDAVVAIVDAFTWLKEKADAARQAVVDFFTVDVTIPDWVPIIGGGGGGNEPTTDSSGVTRTPYQAGAQSTQYDRDNSPAFSGLRAGAGIGSLFREAAADSDLFTAALSKLNAASIVSNSSLMAQASTVPMYTGATRDADSATGAMASNMGQSFSRMSQSAMSNFTSMQSSAGSQTSAMQATAASNAASMSASVGGSILGMRTASALQMGLMASSAATSGTEMSAGMTGWLAGATARIAASMISIVSTVRSVASTGYNAGYYAGTMISSGFANGMLAYLGVIRAAGNAMVAAASQAVIAKAMISSPSKLFMRYGEYIGEGLEIGMRNTLPGIGRTADAMIGTALPNMGYAGGIGSGGTTIIDNSQYIALTKSDFQQLLAKSEKGAAVHDVMTNRNAASQYGKAGA